MAKANKIPEPTPSKPTPMVKWIESTLDWVADHTVFAQVQKRQELLESFSFVDCWTIGCLVLSMIAYGLSFATKNILIQTIIFCVFVARMWEFLPYIFKVTLFTKANKGQTD